MDFLIPAMAKQEGVTEVLKASDQMEWVGRMNNIRNRAEEMVLHNVFTSKIPKIMPSQYTIYNVIFLC